MVDVVDLIGVRFCDHGRSIATGFDCYGLAIEVSRRLGYTLPDLWYKESNDETFDSNAEGIIKSLSDKVSLTKEQKLGNLVIFLECGRMVHIGVILDEDRFIHCDIRGVRVLKLSEYYRKNWKVYKWNV